MVAVFIPHVNIGMRLNDFFGKIYCVNLDRRPDRWAATVSALAGSDVHRVSAVDAASVGIAHPRLMPSEVACTMSHINVLRAFVETGNPACLVIEDDIIPMDGWVETFNSAARHLPSGEWDVFYLAANHVTPPNRLRDTLGKPTRAYSTCAYGVSREGAAYLLRNVVPDRAQVDVQYATLNRGRYFCVVPNMFTQRPDFSDVQGGWVDYTSAFGNGRQPS